MARQQQYHGGFHGPRGMDRVRVQPVPFTRPEPHRCAVERTGEDVDFFAPMMAVRANSGSGIKGNERNFVI